MSTRKPYTAKTLAGAQRRVRELEKLGKQYARLLEQFDRERKFLAKLAATGPAFYNPFEIANAQHVRDEILASMNLKPDGSPL